MVESKAKNIKKMLSWSESSSEDEGDELKAIEKEVITHRRKLRVVDEPQLLRRKVDTNTINPKFLRVTNSYISIERFTSERVCYK